MNFRQEIIDEQAEKGEEGDQLDDDEINTLAYNKLIEQGVGTDDITQVICEDYTDEEIKNDRDAINWEQANEEVERVEEQKKQELLNMQKEQERLRIEEEYNKRQKEAQAQEEKMMKQLQDRQRELEEKQKLKE